MPSALKAASSSASLVSARSKHDQNVRRTIQQPDQRRLVNDWQQRLRRWRQFDADSQSTLAECFDAAYVSRMTVPDAEPALPSKRALRVTDPWRHEWQRGVQVPIDSDRIEPTIRRLSPHDNPLHSEAGVPSSAKPRQPAAWRLPPRQFLRTDPAPEDLPAAVLEGSVSYCSDELDAKWMRLTGVAPDDLEAVITAAEVATHARLQASLRGTAGLGIEYDASVACSACLCPEAGPDNEIVFCDGCDAAVHQACYGLTDVPDGSWLCQPCSRGLRRRPDCLLCPARDATSSASAASFGNSIAMKSAGCDPDAWCHVACALWLPEVTFGDVDAMTDPLQDFEAEVPPWRRALLCRVCRQRGVGACVRCGVRRCKAAFHVGCLATSGGVGGRLASVEGRDGHRKYLVYCERHADTAEAARAMGREREWRKKREQLMKLKRKLKQIKRKPAQLLLQQQLQATPKAAAPDNGLLNKRNMRLKELEANFHTAVSPGDLRRRLGSRKIDAKTVSLILDYWKLKRTANGCRPMLSTAITDCTDSSGHLCKQLHQPLLASASSSSPSAASASVSGGTESGHSPAAAAAVAVVSAQDAKLLQQARTLVRLRLDLERVRNLCYLVVRREKTKRSLLQTCQRIGECHFQQQQQSASHTDYTIVDTNNNSKNEEIVKHQTNRHLQRDKTTRLRSDKSRPASSPKKQQQQQLLLQQMRPTDHSRQRPRPRQLRRWIRQTDTVKLHQRRG